ncbi:MAG TPA: T6SS effector BTH_I2691 family protein [Pseudomonas sp.]|uniref:T6SS effector BTH_I2691 family protein n=1 Tax=Pseudomonas sp. TaxID=306 RepID=UPI002B4726C9|nr:T6SS effector BTH_I2691 family protein [Pseudomonas sp.]HKS14826.1 T6SS effector BTH_I2691 family protein [Pseudomonas sp.]
MTGTDPIADLLAYSRKVANSTRSDAAPSPVVDCKRSITLLPLRYGIIGSPDPQGAALLTPELPPNLGTAVRQTPLAHARYAVRCLRQGYVYVFVKRRAKDYACEATYRVHHSGLLQPVFPHEPGQAIPGIQNLGRWTITVVDPEDIEEARLLFTHDPLSPDMLARYRDVSAFRDLLQRFDLRVLSHSCSFADDVLGPDALDSTVAEYLAGQNPKAREALERQAFPPFRDPHAPGEAAQDMSGVLAQCRRELIARQGCAVVLNDAVGIVQELNAWRNDAIEINRAWLQTPDKDGITNERRYAVAQALDNIKEAMQKGYIDKAVDNAAARLRSAHFDARDTARLGVSFVDLEQEAQRHDPQRVRDQATQESLNAFDRYQVLLDWDGAKANVQAEFARRDKQAQALMDLRSIDHLAWLSSDLLKDALALYDRRNPVWGQAFTEQMGLCLIGMNACESGASYLAGWWSDITIDERNLAWRALTRNNAQIEQATRQALANAKEDEPLTASTMLTMLGAQNANFKIVADLLAKSDAAVEAAMADHSQPWLDRARLTRSLTLFAQAHQYLFKLLPTNAVDRHLLAPMLGFIHANLGEAVTRLRLQDLAAAGATANEARVAGQVNSHINRVRETLTNDFQNSGGGQFYKLRVGVIVATIESVVLLTKAGGADKGSREYAELTAAALITAAAGLELAATGVGYVATRYAPSTVVGRGASIVLGGLRLWSGSLTLVSGGVSAAFSFMDAENAFSKQQYTLATAYLAQTIVTLGITGLVSALALSTAGPYLEWLLTVTERNLARRALPFIIRWSATLAAPEITAILGLALGWATVAGVVTAIAIYIIAPDDLESWCRHSSLRALSTSGLWKPFTDQEKELKSLYQSFATVK